MVPLDLLLLCGVGNGEGIDEGWSLLSFENETSTFRSTIFDTRVKIYNSISFFVISRIAVSAFQTVSDATVFLTVPMVLMKPPVTSPWLIRLQPTNRYVLVPMISAVTTRVAFTHCGCVMANQTVALTGRTRLIAPRYKVRYYGNMFDNFSPRVIVIVC